MNEEDEVGNDSSFAGSLHLLFSLHLTEIILARNAYDELRTKIDVLDWIAQDFLCDTIHFSSSASIVLVGSERMDSNCGQTSLLFNNRGRRRLRRQKKLESTIILNSPTALTKSYSIRDFNLTYTTWNVTFPVYEWGYGNVQEELQESLNELIEDDKLPTPWGRENGYLAVYGQEEIYFGKLGLQQQQLQTNNNYFGIPENEAYLMQGIGVVIMVLHTILLIAAHIFGKSYLKRKQEEKRKKAGKNKRRVQISSEVQVLTKASKTTTLKNTLDSRYLPRPAYNINEILMGGHASDEDDSGSLFSFQSSNVTTNQAANAPMTPMTILYHTNPEDDTILPFSSICCDILTQGTGMLNNLNLIGNGLYPGQEGESDDDSKNPKVYDC